MAELGDDRAAEVVIDTTALSAEESAQEILLYLEREGFIGAEDSVAAGATA